MTTRSILTTCTWALSIEVFSIYYIEIEVAKKKENSRMKGKELIPFSARRKLETAAAAGWEEKVLRMRGRMRMGDRLSISQQPNIFMCKLPACPPYRLSINWKREARKEEERRLDSRWFSLLSQRLRALEHRNCKAKVTKKEKRERKSRNRKDWLGNTLQKVIINYVAWLKKLENCEWWSIWIFLNM